MIKTIDKYFGSYISAFTYEYLIPKGGVFKKITEEKLNKKINKGLKNIFDSYFDFKLKEETLPNNKEIHNKYIEQLKNKKTENTEKVYRPESKISKSRKKENINIYEVEKSYSDIIFNNKSVIYE